MFNTIKKLWGGYMNRINEVADRAEKSPEQKARESLQKVKERLNAKKN